MDSSDFGGKAGKYRMDQKKIDRINELAKKARTPEGLTPEETQERATLRREVYRHRGGESGTGTG